MTDDENKIIVDLYTQTVRLSELCASLRRPSYRADVDVLVIYQRNADAVIERAKHLILLDAVAHGSRPFRP